MKHRYSGLATSIQIFTDLFLLNLSFWIALWIRFPYLGANEGVIPTDHYYTLALVFNLIWLAILPLANTYRYSRHNFNLSEVLLRLGKHMVIHLGLVVLFWVLVKGYYYSRGHLALTYSILVGLGLLSRFIAVYVIKRYRLSGNNTRNYIVVGYGELSETIPAYFDMNPDMGYAFKGFFDRNPKQTNVKEWSTHREELEELLMDERIDFIYCCQPYLTSEVISEIVELGEKYKVKVMLLMDFTGFTTNEISVEYHDYLPIIEISTKRFSNVRSEVFKRIFDIIFSSAVLIFLSPVYLIIGLLVKLTSNGPVFFVQERSGRWGQPFYIYKFRSMVVNAEKMGQHSQGASDKRITSIGRFLRKTRLDELPQFINVLKGDMSVVGPRPLARYDVEMLMKESPTKFKRILTIRPGITSIGQVKVGYADNAEESVKRMNYDLLYVNQRSFKTDVWLIMQTVLLVLQRKGK